MDAALSPVSGRTPADGLFYEPKRFRNIYQAHDSTLIFEYEQLTTYRQSLKAGKRTELISSPQHICQSGLWVHVGSLEGSYATVGSFKGTYSGINTTGKQYRLYVWGGNPPNRKINYGDSDNCVNTYSLIATVGGLTVARDYNGNSTWQKTGNINFDVPNGSTFSIVSNGMMSYGCDYGSFTVLRFQ
ncbi:hypothetical protein [Enterobacter cloacae complex sp.]|uniref:hypothetical protein n=1 Tax=Enterobacter cloacae complex sp. TaxID=2027919 RepID=UPI0020B155ED|nr:hypothetical protein [Enterobacter cloacae complex sp.]